MAKMTVPVSQTENVSFAEAPLLCVIGVHDIASGDLSMTGRVTASQ